MPKTNISDPIEGESSLVRYLKNTQFILLGEGSTSDVLLGAKIAKLQCKGPIFHGVTVKSFTSLGGFLMLQFCEP